MTDSIPPETEVPHLSHQGSSGLQDVDLPQDVSESEATPPVDNWFHTLAGVMGNVLEWYDFALFGFFSDIIAKVFFPPSEGEYDNLIKSFSIFGAAFIMRPIGGLVIGYLGDKHGRKHALTKSLMLMAIPTTLMGVLPTYEQAGSLSIVLLVLCRMLQGISVGGQLPASLVYTVEKRAPETWGYYGSLPMVAANVGTLLGNLCGAFLRSVLNESQLESFGWRIPFLSGILIAFVAMWLKKNGQEVHTNASVYDAADSVTTNPIKVAFQPSNRLALFSTTLAPFLWAGGFYLTFVWMAIYMEELLEPPVKGAFWINAMAMLLGMTFLLPVAGSLSDRFGRVPTMTCAGIALGVLGPIIIRIIAAGNSFFAFLSQLVLGICLSFFGGPLCAWLVESFSPEVRLTSASLGYDIAHATVGGFSPAMATALFSNRHVAAPGMLYPIFAVISLVGLWMTTCFGSGRNDIQSDSAATKGDLELQERQPQAPELPEVS